MTLPNTDETSTEPDLGNGKIVAKIFANLLTLLDNCWQKSPKMTTCLQKVDSWHKSINFLTKLNGSLLVKE